MLRASAIFLFSTAALGLVACAAPSADAEDSSDPTADEPEVRATKPAPEKRRSLQGFTCPAAGSAVKVAFFDADSTLRVSKAGSVTASAIHDVDILPFAASNIRALRKDGFLIAIVSNQGGVASGRTTLEVAEGALAFAASQLTKLGARVDYFDLAEAQDDHRKPEIGMARELDTVLDTTCHATVDLSKSRMTGDSAYQEGKDGPSPDGRPADDFSNSDRLFAENLRVSFAEPTDAFGWRDFGVFNVLGRRELVQFLVRIDAAADEAEHAGDATRAKALRTETKRNRKINGL